METASSPQSFSVDFLLGEIAASNVETPAPNTAQRILQAAQQAQQHAEVAGDFGATLIAEVQQYLVEASDDLQQFAAIARQLGDMCIDHSIEHGIVEESARAETAGHGSSHNHGSGRSSQESHGHHHTESTKKRKTKKRQRRSLLDLYLWRLQQQKPTV